MKRRLPLLLIALIPFLATNYAVAQNLTEKDRQEIRKMIREELEAAASRRAAPPSEGPRGVRPAEGIPDARGARPGEFETGPAEEPSENRRSDGKARRAIEAAERAVEADKSLTKPQRLAALQSLQMAKNALDGVLTTPIPLQFRGVVPGGPGGGRSDLFYDGPAHGPDGLRVLDLEALRRAQEQQKKKKSAARKRRRSSEKKKSSKTL